MAKSMLPDLPGYPAGSMQPWFLEVAISMTVLALVCVALRLVSRRMKAQPLWWDDYMIVFSMAWYLVVVAFSMVLYHYGMGKHADQVGGLENIVNMAKWLVVAEVLYAFNLGWTKLSLLLMYYRIFRVPYFKNMAWAIGVFVMAWVITITFLFIFICVPVEKLWYPDIPGRCINQVGTWIANAISTIVTDLIILFMPIPQIWKLQLRKPEKIGLTVAFGLGFFVVFTSAYRTSVLFTYNALDPTYTITPTVAWTAIEMSAGIVSTCLPTMLPVFNVFLRFTGLYSATETIIKSTRAFGSRQDKSSGSRPGPSQGTTNDNKTTNSFYQLHDDTDSGGISKGMSGSGASGSSQTPIEGKLRPDTKGFGYTVQTYANMDTGRDDESGDDIPLHGIRVQTDFERSTMQR